jgi:hypothetical protein
VECLAVAAAGEQQKSNKYQETASQHEAKFIPFVLESTGGMGRTAQELMKEIVLASREYNTLWEHSTVSREAFSMIAIAVQKGNAMTIVAGRNRAIGNPASSPAA